MHNFDFKLEPGKSIENNYKYEKKNPVISIITCVYNGKDIFLQTVNSVLNQTYPYYEFIIIDDGSTSKETLALLDKVEKMDDRISLYHKKNEGLSASKKYGLNKCSSTSRYVVYLDCDDLINKTYLETLYLSLETNPDYAFAYTDSVGFEGQEYLWQRSFNIDIMKKENLFVSTAMIKKDVLLKEEKAFTCEKAVFEDWMLWLNLLKKGYKPLHVNYFGFWYRRSDAGELSKAKKKNRKRAINLIKKLSKEVTNYVEAKQYPVQNYNWDGIMDMPDSVITPNVQNKDKKKLLFIIPWMVMGGADKFNLDVLKLLDKNKYEVTIITTIPTIYQWRVFFEKEAYEVFDLSTFIDEKYWNGFINYIIDSRKIDLVLVSNSSYGYASIPYIKACYPTIPIIDYIHMEEWYNRNGGYSRDSSAVNEFIDKTYFCNKKSQLLMNEMFGIDKKKTDTIYIGVDEKNFDANNYDKKELLIKYKIPQNKNIIGFICRIDYQKRPLLFVHIMKKLLEQNNNLHFIIAGDGPLLKQMRTLARKFKITYSISFLGKCNNPSEIYSICDITVNCSLKEGLALTSYESLSMGVPVVSSDVGGQSELIDDTVGAIVPLMQKEEDIHFTNYLDEEIDIYVSSINRILNNLDKYKVSCRKKIINGFTIDNMIKNFEKEIDSVIKTPNQNIVKMASNIDSKNLLKDYINLYFMSCKEESSWSKLEYTKAVYGGISEEFKKKHRKLYMLKYSTDKFFYKLKIGYQASNLEASIIKFIKNFVRTLKELLNVIINFIKCLVGLIKGIVR